MFKLQSPSKSSPSDAMHLSRCFFYCSEQVLNSLILVASGIFCFTSSTLAKHFLLRIFFIHGNKKQVARGEIGRIGRAGQEGHAIFGQTPLNTQHSVGRCTCQSPIVKWANTLKKSSKKNSLEPNAASHNNASQAH